MDSHLRRRSADRFLVRWGPLLAFVILSLAVAYAIQQSAQSDADKLRRGLVEACQRSNTLRSESNLRIDSHITERDVVLQLIVATKQTLRASSEAEVRRGAADLNRLSDKLEKVRFDKLDLIECEKVVPKP